MFRKKEKTLSSRTPLWFKEWHSHYFKPVESLSRRNEKIIYVILASVLVLNTAGNYFHIEITGFIMRLFAEVF